jgi:hypothetical protein
MRRMMQAKLGSITYCLPLPTVLPAQIDELNFTDEATEKA